MKFFVLTFLLSTSAFANQAYDIVKKMTTDGEGFGFEESEISMTLVDAYGKEAHRKLKAFVQEDLKNGNKSLIEFTIPFDVKGTKLLSWRSKNDDNSQWLYLPKLKRVKKLLGSQQSGSFMGSEFSYEDISGSELEKYNYELVKETDQEYIIESKPKKESGYSKIIATYYKQYGAPTHAEYYDRKKVLLKESKIDGYTVYEFSKKKVFKPAKIVMKNRQTKKSSILTWDKRKIQESLPATYFSPNSMN